MSWKRIPVWISIACYKYFYLSSIVWLKLLHIYKRFRKIDCYKKVIIHRSVYIDLLPDSSNANELVYCIHLLPIVFSIGNTCGFFFINVCYRLMSIITEKLWLSRFKENQRLLWILVIKQLGKGSLKSMPSV